MNNPARIKLFNQRFEPLRSFIATLPEIFDHTGETIYHDRNVIKKIMAPDGVTMLNVKRYRAPRFVNRYVYSWGIRKPKGERAFRYPQTLLERAIATPEPIAYIEERNAAGLLGFSYFVSVHCDYDHRMYELGEASPATCEAIAAPFARFTAEMHSKGVLHLDYSPGNILFRQSDEGGYEFMIVDTNRMRFGEVDWRSGCDSFKRIWGPKRFFEQVVREYARCRGIDEAKALERALATRRQFWLRFKRKHPIPFKLEL